ncbi:unannotated protein [freshwater metagenome]|uniref:Unannotated protein n=1 Tax=freshwater metagenome TaxID=449393 RepID=A0A6J6WP17_9ZZZZ
MLVLARSRPARYRCADFKAISNCANVSGSVANASRTRFSAARRSSTFFSLRMTGLSLLAAPRIVSTSEVTKVGLVSHVSERISHSLGPRLPNSRMNAANFSAYSLESFDKRESSHITRLGAAESTSPMAVINVSANDGSPKAAAIAPSAPGPIEVPAVISR